MKAAVISTELRDALKRLRLGQMIDTLSDRLAMAERDEMPFQDLLLALLTDEINRRQTTAAAKRAHEAGIDPDMVFERWDKSAKVSYDKRVMQELMSLRFIEAKRNVVVLGPVGVGKTFVGCALGHLACKAGFKVHFERADSVLRRLRQSRLDNSREATMVELATVDLLIIDDFALEPMTRDESRDIYQLFVERNARFSTVVTSNRDTAEWLSAFDDTLLAQSAVDRFKNNAYDLVIEGESYRARLKPRIEAEPPPAAPVRKVQTPGRRKQAARTR
jgi:DNA replication protein DnaC